MIIQAYVTKFGNKMIILCEWRGKGNTRRLLNNGRAR